MLEEFSREYAEFNSALMSESYLFYSGQKPELIVGPIYERHSDLFAPDSIAQLKSLLDETDDYYESRSASLRRLLMFSIDQFLAASVKELTEKISEYETDATIEWHPNRVTFNDSAVILTTEPNRDLRRAVYERRRSVISASNDLRAERLNKMHAAARKIAASIDPQASRNGSNGAGGCESYLKLYEQLFGLDCRELATQARRLLDQTQSVYTSRLADALKNRLGIDCDEAERHDALYFLHVTHYDDCFPSDDLFRIYKETMAGLGICVDNQKNIEIDSEPRPNKTARAFCAPINVPDQIKLVIRPIGGQTDYLTLFHEAGHAQHYGWTSSDLRPEFKYTFDYALSETYAFLFNHLPGEPLWLGGLLGFEDSDDITKSIMLARLITVRRYAAKLLYEFELHSSVDLSNAPSLYSELQTSATGFHTDETEFLYDLDDSFYSASYLRAWAFEVSLREYLKTRFGAAWWTSSRAGNFLREIWETGDRYTADEMAEQIGLGPLSFEPLIGEFVTQLAG